MIRCGKCHRFAALIYSRTNRLGDVLKIRVECKKHGKNWGEFDDYEEIGLVESP